MKATKPLFIALVVLAMLGALVYALTQKPPAPDATFTTLDGRQVSIEDLRGKVVLVNFWATSCSGCVKKMPGMIEAYRDYKDRGFEVVAVAMSYDPPHHVANFVQDQKLPFPVVLDATGELARAFGGVQVTPTTFLIGKDGSILDQKLGDFDFGKLRAQLDKELS